MKKTLVECKNWLDEYISLKSELSDAVYNTSNTKVLTYKVRNDKPLLFKLRISDLGNGWELSAIEHTFQIENVSKMMNK